MTPNRRVVTICLGVIVGMVGAAYAAVPFYRWFCQTTGFDGTPLRADAAPNAQGLYDRVVRVRFDANVAPELAWSFSAGESHQDIHVGDTGITFFTAKNIGRRDSLGHATFNVTPEKAGKYFVKVSCFCFSDQPLAVGETREMPVNFFIDPAIMDDPLVEDVKEITLSYTFFPQAGAQASADGGATTVQN